MKLVTDESLLRRPCTDASLRNGRTIARQLFSFLNSHNRRPSAQFGIGLAAPQLGILKRVCVLNLKKPVALVNPVIVAHSGTKVPCEESCLSFPGQSVQTWRYTRVTVRSLNQPDLVFGPQGTEDWDRLIESVLAQHEIAHLDGLLHFDFRKEDYEWPTPWRDG